jgi:hypothetical protein
MRFYDFFKEYGLGKDDLLMFANVLNEFQLAGGKDSCWCLKHNNFKKLKGFTTSHPSKPLYKGKDARLLVLALADQYQDESNLLVIRKHTCLSPHCINPGHYFFGTKQDVCFERGQRRGSVVTPELVTILRSGHRENKTYASLARQYKLPYHVVRRICLHEVYD